MEKKVQVKTLFSSEFRKLIFLIVVNTSIIKSMSFSRLNTIMHGKRKKHKADYTSPFYEKIYKNDGYHEVTPKKILFKDNGFYFKHLF